MERSCISFLHLLLDACVDGEREAIAGIHSSACLLQPGVHGQCYPAHLGKILLYPGPFAVGCVVAICRTNQILCSCACISAYGQSLAQAPTKGSAWKELWYLSLTRRARSEKSAAAIVRTIVSVVAHCHSLGVMHR